MEKNTFHIGLHIWKIEEATRRKRAQKKKNKRKKKSPQTRYFEKVENSNDLPISKLVVDPEAEAKMSEVILEFAKPFLDECEDEASEKKSIALAILIWNVSLFPEKDREWEIEKVCSKLSPSDDANDFSALMGYVDIMLERKKKYYSDNKRVIIKYQISGYGKNRRLDVASTLSP